jgi:hypothetical protein
LVSALERGSEPEQVIEVRRPGDLLVLGVRLRNLELKTDVDGPRLVRQPENAVALLLVDFPPQSFGEEAFLLEEGRSPLRPLKGPVPRLKEPVPQLPSARVRMSGPSRLAFTMPPDQSELPYTLAGVLAAMRTWPQSLDVGALPDPGPEGSDVGLGLARFHEALGSPSARQSITTLSAALEDSGAKGVHGAIVEAGERIADRAAGALIGGASRLFGETTMRVMQAELADLQDRFSSLRSGPAHEAGIAALALAAGSSLADLAGRLRPDVDLIHEVPYLPLLLAPHSPADTATALELPYRVLLSPIEKARWQHRDGPVAHGGRTELWHTRMRTSEGEKGADGVSKVRALWSPDYPEDDFSVIDNEAHPRPFRMSLRAQDRQSLVKLMAGYGERAHGTRFTPRSSRARRLHLSSLGSLTEIEGAWDALPDGVDLEQWRHLASLGRDAYVRVVYRGFLLPFGHNASLVRVTERKFDSLEGDRDRRLAILRQRHFIIVRRRIVDYNGEGHVYDGRGFPFPQVEILTRITPDLKDPGVGKSMLVADAGDQIYGGKIANDKAFWPMIAAASGDASDFPFEVLATDIAGSRVTFSMPMLFVSKEVNEQKSAEVRRAYNRKNVAQRRTAHLGGTTICYAPFGPGDKGDPRLPSATMTFAAGEVRELGATRPNFYPETDAARVGIKPIQKLLGRPDAVVDVAYPSVFKEDGFAGKNQGGLFLHVINQTHTLAFGGGEAAKTDAIGGLAAPGMSILGLSKVMGPVSGQPPADMSDRAQVEDKLDNVIQGTFNPADFFKDAKILGGVNLAELLGTVPGLTGAKVPKLLSRELPPGAPDRVEASFDWETEVDQSDKDNLIIPRADRNQPTRLHMHGLVTTPLKDPTAATSTATAELTNFKVNLFGFIVLWFDELQFAASAGQKPDVTVGIHSGDEGVAFGGPLEFVNELRKFIPANGFSDPPSLSVTPSGIAASYSLNLPVIGVGIFALKGASLGAGFSLPFDATPASVRFNFSERQHPFSLTVSMLGGGGFFALTVSSQGVQEIEAALEFGAATSINLGVASGGVEIKAGVYFHWKQVSNKGSVELAGYVRLHGELCVVGLISASLTFNLQLAYLKQDGTSSVWGEATLTVEVEIAFVGFDVAVKCRREFAGGEADPKFIELIPDEPTWAEYCDAFAVEG